MKIQLMKYEFNEFYVQITRYPDLRAKPRAANGPKNQDDWPKGSNHRPKFSLSLGPNGLLSMNLLVILCLLGGSGCAGKPIPSRITTPPLPQRKFVKSVEPARIAQSQSAMMLPGTVTVSWLYPYPKLGISFKVWSTTNLFTGFSLTTNTPELSIQRPRLPAEFFKVETVAATNIALAWDRSPDASVTGYKIYSGMSSGVYTRIYTVGNTTNTLIPWLGVYYAATANDANDLESTFSNEVNAAIPVPHPVTNLQVK